MPKLKTKKSVSKRFRVTKTGKLKRSQTGRGHLLRRKTSKRKRRLRKGAFVSKTDKSHIRRYLPYG